MSTATSQFVKLRMEEKVAVVTIDNPPVNALNSGTMSEFATLLDQLEADPNVKAIVVTGNGMAFVAGADINEIAAISSPDEAKALVRKGQQVLDRLEALKKPVIAAINGVALGGGLELALACHIRIASDRARLGLVEINLGIMPGFGGTQRLPRVVGWSKATEMMLTADNITAQEAYRIGLVNKVVPEGDVVKQALGLAKKISSFGAKAIEAILTSLEYGRNHSLAESLEKESDLFAGLTQTADMREGVTAFKEKRRPNFTDK
ncbi:MAG TPA: enoyl-CoA hydratase [Oscillatoriaceae cyanobacterium]